MLILENIRQDSLLKQSLKEQNFIVVITFITNEENKF